MPIGVTLAFDCVRGRLWVVCGNCGRWNLTPFEERWEALEECERLFLSTTTRASTGQIGLAEINRNLQLIRVGAPQQSEFAAWRYGKRFSGAAAAARRRHAAFLGGYVVTAAAATAYSAPILFNVIPLIGFFHFSVSGKRYALVRDLGELTRPGGPAGSAGIQGELCLAATLLREAATWHLSLGTGRNSEHGPVVDHGYVLVGADALRASALILSRANRQGGSHREVQGAVDLLAEVAYPTNIYSRVAQEYSGQDLWRLPAPTRFALEMAAHEEIERRALDGELAILLLQWRDAEEIGKLADSLV